MAQEHDYIRPIWRISKTARNTNQEPYSSMIRYAKELAFDGSRVSIEEIDETDGSKLDAIKFTNPHGLEVDGAYDTNKLKKDITYEVHFVVKVTDDVSENFQVKLQLICPDGKKIKSNKNLSQMEKNEWVGLYLGEFTNKNPNKVKFNFKTVDATTEKKGLIIVGAIIVDVGAVPKPVAMAK